MHLMTALYLDKLCNPDRKPRCFITALRCTELSFRTSNGAGIGCVHNPCSKLTATRRPQIIARAVSNNILAVTPVCVQNVGILPLQDDMVR